MPIDPYTLYQILYGTAAAAGVGGLGAAGYGTYRAAKAIGGAFRRKRRYKSTRSSIGRGMRGSVGIHRFVRVATPSWISLNQSTGFNFLGASTGPSFGMCMGFALDKVHFQVGTSTAQSLGNDYTDLTSLYDMYKIESVEIKIMWSNTGDSIDSTRYVAPVVQYAIDYDDLVAPTGSGQLTQFENFKLYQFGTGGGKNCLNIRFRPKINESVNSVSSIGGNGNVARPSEFLSSSTPAVIHTGVKLWWDVANNNVNISADTFQVYVKYNLLCKHVR